jgi:hypothetical protein
MEPFKQTKPLAEMTREEKVAAAKALMAQQQSSSPPVSTGGFKQTKPLAEMSREEKLEAAKALGAKITAPEVNATWKDKVLGFAAGTIGGAFQEVAKIGALPATLLGIETAGQQIKEAGEAGSRLVEKVLPGTSGAVEAGNVVGSIAPYAVPVGVGLKGASTLLGMAGKGATAGAVSGALSGAAAEVPTSKVSEVLSGAAAGGLTGALTGAVIAPAIGALGKGISNVFGTAKPAEKAVQGLIDDIAPKVKVSPVELADEAGTIANEAKRTAEKILKTHNDEVSKLYGQAYSSKVAPGELGAIEQNPTVVRALNDLMKREDALGDQFRSIGKDSFAKWDAVKKQLNADYSKFANKAQPDKAAAGATLDIIHDLTEALDNVNPAYKQARLLAGEDITGINKLSAGPIGKLAKSKDGALTDISRKIFNPRLEEADFINMKNAYVKQSPDLWNQLTRKYIEDSMDSLKNVGGEKDTPLRLYQAVLGNDKKAGQLIEALNVPGKNAAINRAKLTVISKVFDDAFASGGVIDSVPNGAGLFIRALKGRDAVKFNNTVVDFLTDSKHNSQFTKIINNESISEVDKVAEVLKLLEPKYGSSGVKVTTGIAAAEGKIGAAITNEDR